MRFAQRFILAAILLVGGITAFPALQHVQAQGVYTQPAINKSFGSISIVPGTTTQLTVKVFNENPWGLINVAYTDTMPAAITIGPVGVISNTCGGSVSAVPGTSSFSLTNGVVAAKTTAVPAECEVVVEVTSIVAGNHVNTIPAGALTATDAPTGLIALSNQDPASATLQVDLIQPPSISKSFTNTTVFTGQASRLEIRITNNDTVNTLTEVSLTDLLPAAGAGQVVIADPPTASLYRCGTGSTLTAVAGSTSLSLSNATIIPGSSYYCRIRVNVLSTTPGVYVNEIPAGTMTSKQGLTNAFVSAQLNVQGIGVLKSFQYAYMGAGDINTVTVTLQNPTGTPLTNVSLTDVMPSDMIVVGAASPQCNGGTVTHTLGWVILSGGTIPGGGTPTAPTTCTLVFQVTVPVNAANGNRTNTILAGDLSTAEGVTNYLGVSATTNVRAALSGTKSFSPSSIPIDGTSTMTITLRNATGTPITNVGFTDTLTTSANVVVDDPADATNTCGGTWTTTPGSHTVTLAGGTIPASPNPYANPVQYGSCTLTVKVTSAVAGGPWTNTLAANSVAGLIGTTSVGNLSSITSPITVTPGLVPVGVSKNFSPNPVGAGSNSTLTITVTAPADSAVSLLSLTDTLPAGLLVAASPAPTTTCTPSGLLNAPAGGDTITLGDPIGHTTGASLAAGASCTITVRVVAALPGTYPNTIPVSNIYTAEGRTNTAAATRTLTATSMAVTKNFQPDTVAPNGRSRLTILLSNSSPSNLVNAYLNDPLSTWGGNGSTTGLFVDTADPDLENTCGGSVTFPNTQTIRLTGGTIPAAISGVPGTCRISVNVIGRSTTLPRTANNTITTSNAYATIEGTATVIRAIANAVDAFTVREMTIRVVKGFTPVLVYGGAASTLRVELLNPNPAELTGIQFVDTMPAGMILADPPVFDASACGADADLTGTPGTSTFTFTGGRLAASTSCAMTMRVTMTVNGNLTNTIPVGGVTTFNGVTNPDLADASLTNLAGAGVSKAFTPNPILAGSGNYSILTITISNTSGLTLTGMGLTDTLPDTPAGLSIAGAPAPVAATTCTGPAVSLTAVPGTRTIQLSGATLPTGNSCAITVPVTSTQAGTFTNTIPANAVVSVEGITNPELATADLTVLAPDLTITKSNDLSGPAAVGGGFNWIITVSNTGSGDAVFNDGQVLLRDPLPAGASYGAPLLGGSTDVTNFANLVCAIDGSNVLTCAASGAAVTIGDTSGSFSVTVPVTVQAAGILSNTVTVDPDGGVTENDETNNTASDAVVPGKGAAAAVTTIHDAAHNAVTSILLGATVHDSVVVSGGGVTPSGSVEFYFFNNGTCTLPAAFTSAPFTLAGGTVDATTFTQTPGAGGAYAFQAYYYGDANYDPVLSACEPLDLLIPAIQVVKTSTATAITAAGQVVPYTMTVTNSGNVVLTGVTVSDPICDAAPALVPGGDSDGDGELDLTETWTYTCSHTVTQAEMDAGGNLSNTVTADSSESLPDDDTVNIPITQNPVMTVVKSSTTASLTAAPATVPYSYLVTNTGNITLTGISLSDNNDNDDLTCPATSLAVGGSMTCTATHTFTQAELDNNGGGDGDLDNIVTASSNEAPDVTDDLSIPITQSPAIDIEKSTNGSDADVPPGPLVTPGSAVSWTYVVTNTGNTSLSAITATDDQGVTITCPKTSLAVGEAMTCTASGTAQVGQYANIGTADAASPTGTPVRDTDPSHYFGSSPAVTLVKSTNGEDANVPTGPEIPAGGTVNWTYLVTNTGNVPLLNVTVTDDQGVTVSCPKTALVVGEAMTCTASGTAITGQYANVGTVSASDALGNPVADSDPSHYFGTSPAITLVKSTNGEDANTVTGPVVATGSTVAWTYLVTNTGNVPLLNVTVTDDQGVTVSCPKTALAVGEAMTCTASGIAVLGQYANVGTASGTYGGVTVNDTDPSHYFGVNPALGIAKRLTPAPVMVSPGTWEVQFEFLVSNYGTTAMNDLQVTDDLAVVFPLPTTFSVHSLTSPTLTVNPFYDGAGDINLLTGTDSLAVGASANLSLVIRVIPTSAAVYLNHAIVLGNSPTGIPDADLSQDGTNPDPDGDGDPGNNDTPTPVDFGPDLFDPPLGIKLLDDSNLPFLRWSVIWINTTNIVAVNAGSSDPIPEGTVFHDNGVSSGYPLPPGVLPFGTRNTGVSCTDASAVTTTTYCYYEGPTVTHPRGRVVWLGVLGPDLGQTDPALADDEITIAFGVRVDDGRMMVNNTASINADQNGDGDMDDPGEQNVASANASWTAPAQALPATGFAPGRVTDLSVFAPVQYAPLEQVTLEIPVLNVNIPIVGVPRQGDGWNVTWLGSQAGWLEGSAFPSWAGNSVLTGHVYLANGMPGPFVNLSALSWGDHIIVHAYGSRYVYEVRSERIVRPDNTNILAHEEYPWLTLITCRSFDEDTGTYRWRVVVRAVQIAIEPER